MFRMYCVDLDILQCAYTVLIVTTEIVKLSNWECNGMQAFTFILYKFYLITF